MFYATYIRQIYLKWIKFLCVKIRQLFALQKTQIDDGGDEGEAATELSQLRPGMDN